ncbi:MAG TPA: hypothetical protein VF941_02975 [Clostridia bacterium]
MKQLTPEFKAVVAFLLVLAAYVILGFNVVATQKMVNLATQQSTAALQLGSQTANTLKTVVTTPTVAPTSTPSAIRISTPAKATSVK